MKEKSKERTYQYLLLLFSLALLALLLGFSLLTVAHIPELMTKEEMQSYDFTENVGKLNRNLFDFYAEKLYTPEDFASGNTTPPTFTESSDNNDERQYIPYGTYRLSISLPAGQVYAISADSATYSQKVWINGQLLSELGTVADNAEDSVPKTNHYTICFTATDAPTEIVVQRANFVHKSGVLFELNIGPQKQIFQMANAELFRSVVALGILFTAFMFFLGISFFFPHRKRFLWFSLACLALGIRNSFVSPKPVMILFPNLNWYFGHKLECCSMILAYLFMMLFYNSVFFNVVPKAIRILGYALCAAGIGLYMLLPSTVYSYVTQTAVYIIAVYLIFYASFFIVGLVRKKVIMRNNARILMAVGVVITILCSLTDEILYRKTADYNISQIGMLIFIFLTALALAIQMREAEDALDEATAREKQMRQMNRDLNDLYRMRSDFMSDISHELKTPLTVMSGYAGLTKMQLEKNAVNEKTPENLEIIQKEAVRLGALVEQLKTVSADKNQKSLSPVRADINETLRKAADFCAPVCEKNRNKIEVTVPSTPLFALYVQDSIIQVLYNLITNANRHCHNSVIKLKAEKSGSFVTITVADSGDGISPDLLAHIFERGVSGDSGTGLGLALCREIIENNGGIIYIESKPEHGTTVIFTLPNEEMQNG